MRFLQLLLVCWCSGALALTSSIRVDRYFCVSAYWDMITCVLNITADPAGQSNSTYSMKFTDIKRNKTSTCPLVLTNHGHSCVCKVGHTTFFSDSFYYAIQLCSESGCSSLVETFKPSENIQLTPPQKVEVQQALGAINITWISGYEEHLYLSTCIDYELVLQKSQSPWRKILSLREKFISITRPQLDSYGTYCIRVRSIPDVSVYKGVWSEWSPLSCWETKAQEEQENISLILTKCLGPVCVVVGVLLFVFYRPATRMKIKTLSQTPSPAPFFQTLFQKHGGNLQEWLSPQCKFALTYKTEEVLITDAVSVVPMPVTKDPEENQGFLSPPVTQLALGHCQNSYFSLPVMHEPPQPIATVCPENTSYTQLPHSVWGFCIGEARVSVSPQPQVLLETSQADSGCSLEDLSQSPECSLLNSPAVDTSPPCPSSDYCTLNKTAEGVVPVLVTK